MFGNIAFGVNPFDSSSKSREYVIINNRLVFTQELYVEGATIVSVDLLEFIQILQIPALKKVKRITNTLSYMQSLKKLVIKQVNKSDILNYIQTLNSPSIIRKHYEVPDSALEYIQTLYDPFLPKITTVDSVLAFNQSLFVPKTVYINKIGTLNYNQFLFTPKIIQEINLDKIDYVMTLLKPNAKYLTIVELLEFYQTLVEPKGSVVIPLDTLHYVMTLHKVIINSYELLSDMHPYTTWKSYEAQREGRKLIVVQEVEHSANLINDERDN